MMNVLSPIGHKCSGVVLFWRPDDHPGIESQKYRTGKQPDRLSSPVHCTGAGLNIS